mgnify:CR=1 FL=1
MRARFWSNSLNEFVSVRNVQIVMERLGGGGHLNIAGAQLEHYSITEAKDVLKQTLQKMLDEGDI